VSSTVNTVSKYFLGEQVPWSFRLLVLLLFMLVGGGLYLDYLSSQVSYPDFFASKEIKIDPASGKEISIEKLGLETEDRKLLVEWAQDKTRRLNESAKLLYDFAKITLGALIASLTQLISVGVKREHQSTEENEQE